MPTYQLVCPKCQKAVKRLLASYKELSDQKCTDCGTALERAASGPSASVYEKLDNGAMSKAVERLRDAEELYKERSQTADPRAGKGRAW